MITEKTIAAKMRFPVFFINPILPNLLVLPSSALLVHSHVPVEQLRVSQPGELIMSSTKMFGEVLSIQKEL